jgi:hypothetical protein
LGGLALSPHNDKSVKISRGLLSLVGWVRINPKYGSMRPSGAGCQKASAFIENNFGSELAAGTVVQLFDSGPSEMCADIKLCPGDVCSFMYQVCVFV